MKNLLQFVLLTNFICFAQQTSPKGIVYYTQIESINRGAKNGSERFSTLIFDEQKSIYTTQKDSLDNIAETKLREFYPNEKGGGSVYSGLPATKNGSQVYTNNKKDSVWSSFLRGGLQFMREKKIKINWKLENETKKIGPFICNKAITKYRGRDYTAWYTKQIPVAYGPWKLQGLPGLILEAYDANKEIYYSFKSIDYPSTMINLEIKTILNKTNNWMNFKSYLAFCEKNLQDNYERMIMLAKDFPGDTPIKAKIEENFKEITE